MAIQPNLIALWKCKSLLTKSKGRPVWGALCFRPIAEISAERCYPE